MTNLEQRLTRCFLAVFPTMTEEEATSASQDTLEAWDSIASVTLVRVVEEEFGVTIDLFELENLNSFATLANYLRSQAAH